MAHACSLSIETAEAGGFQVGGQLGLHNETMSQTDMGVVGDRLCLSPEHIKSSARESDRVQELQLADLALGYKTLLIYMPVNYCEDKCIFLTHNYFLIQTL